MGRNLRGEMQLLGFGRLAFLLVVLTAAALVAAERPAELDHQIVELNADQSSSGVSLLGDAAQEPHSNTAKKQALKASNAADKTARGEKSQNSKGKASAVKKAVKKIVKAVKPSGHSMLKNLHAKKLVKAGFTAGYNEAEKDAKSQATSSPNSAALAKDEQDALAKDEQHEVSKMQTAHNAAEQMMVKAKKKVSDARTLRLHHAKRKTKQATHRVKTAREERKRSGEALAQAMQEESIAQGSLAAVAVPKSKPTSSTSVLAGTDAKLGHRDDATEEGIKKMVKKSKKRQLKKKLKGGRVVMMNLDAAVYSVVEAGKKVAAASSTQGSMKAKFKLAAAADKAKKAERMASLVAPALFSNPKVVEQARKVKTEISMLLEAKSSGRAEKLVQKLKKTQKNAEKTVAKAAGFPKSKLEKTSNNQKRARIKINHELQPAIKHKQVSNDQRSIENLMRDIKVARTKSKRAATSLKVARASTSNEIRTATTALKRANTPYRFEKLRSKRSWQEHLPKDKDSPSVDMKNTNLKLPESFGIVEQGKLRLDARVRSVEKAGVQLAQATSKSQVNAAKKKLKKVVQAQKRAVKAEKNLASRLPATTNKHAKVAVMDRILDAINSKAQELATATTRAKVKQGLKSLEKAEVKSVRAIDKVVGVGQPGAAAAMPNNQNPVSIQQDEKTAGKRMSVAVAAVIKAGSNFEKAKTKEEATAAKRELIALSKSALNTEAEMVVKAPSLLKDPKLIAEAAHIRSEMILLIRARNAKELKKMHLMEKMKKTLKSAKKSLGAKLEVDKKKPGYKAQRKQEEESNSLKAAEAAAKLALPPLVSAEKHLNYVKAHAKWGVTNNAKASAKKKLAGVLAKAKKADKDAKVEIPAAMAAAAKAKDQLDSAKKKAEVVRKQTEIQPPAKVVVVQRGRKAIEESDKITAAAASVSAAAVKLAQAKTKKEQLRAEKELNVANNQEQQAIAADTIEKSRRAPANKKPVVIRNNLRPPVQGI